MSFLWRIDFCDISAFFKPVFFLINNVTILFKKKITPEKNTKNTIESGTIERTLT